MLGTYFLFPNYIEGILHIIGAIIGFRVARIAREGYRVTRSPTLLRITISFILLTIGFMITGVTYFFGQFAIRIELFGISIALASLFFIIAAIFELAGYFILALGHGIKSFNVLAAPALFGFFTTVSVLSILKSLSFVFLLYGAFETFLSYLEVKRRSILYMFFGFGLLSVGELIKWLALFYTGLNPLMIASILVKLFGFIMLYTPVRSFSTLKGMNDDVDL